MAGALALALVVALVPAPVPAALVTTGPAAAGVAPVEASPWLLVEAGLELAEFKVAAATPAGDSTIVVLRVDPELWDLRLYCASASGEPTELSARGWCEREGLVAAVNAGMYAPDFRTHVGYLRVGDHVNCASENHYRSVAAFGPRRAGIPRFRIFDLDASGASLAAVEADYDHVAQNLRLVGRPGRNRWSPQPKRWSEAALGEDDRGRALLIFSRSPYSMHDLNRLLLSLPLGLVAAQHLEGGPEAQFCILAADLMRDLVGSYETGFWENDDNRQAWPLPNVIGVRRRIAPDPPGAGVR